MNPLSLLLPIQVMQVVNADALMVKLNSGELKTIHLSSIRPPRNEGEVGVGPPPSVCLSVRPHTCAQLCTLPGSVYVGELVASHGRPVN